MYSYSRTPVAPPTGFDVNSVAMSGRVPVADLDLAHIHGFKGDGDTCNLYSVNGDKLIYTIAAVCIVYDVSNNTQTFFREHDDDVTCLSIFEPDERAKGIKKTPRAASGQMGYNPVFYVWDVETCEMLYKLGGKGIFQRAVVGVTFSWDGKHVAAVGMDDCHQIGVWNLVGGKNRDTDEIIPKLLCMKDTQAGTPPMLTRALWCDFEVPVPASVQGRSRVGGSRVGGSRNGSRAEESRIDSRAGASRSGGSRAGSRAGGSRVGSRSGTANSTMQPPPPSTARIVCARSSETMQALVTSGKGKHLKFWTWNPTKENLRPTDPVGPLTFQNAKFGNAPLPKTITDCAPICSKESKGVGDITAVSGTDGHSGFVYLFRNSTATCMSYVEAHANYAASSIQFDPISRYIYSGGEDGMLHAWDMKLKKVEGMSANLNPPEKKKASFMEHPDSIENNATLMCKRKTIFTLGRRHEPLNPSKMAGPMKGSSLRGEGDVWVGPEVTKAKLKHIAIMRRKEGGEEDGEGKDVVTVAVGMARGVVALVDGKTGKPLGEARTGHCAHVYGLTTHPTDPNLFMTVGEDCFLCLWDLRTMRCLKRRTLFAAGKSVAISPDGSHVAVGMFNGVVLIIEWQELFRTRELKMKFVIKDCDEDLDDLKYSPDGTMLAVGSHDNYVDVYDVWVEEKWKKVMKYQRKWRFKGHTSYVTHLDWSKDGRTLQSNCGAYEILYWDVRRGCQIRSTMDSLEADTDWDTWTCVLGFPVMGIWEPNSDGTDVNSLDVCKRRQLIVTADDFGGVNLMRWPAVAKSAAKKVNSGHAAHVMNVRFTCDDRCVVSVGGKDRAIMVWKLNRNDHLEDKQAMPKPKLATKWKPQGGWDNGRELEGVGPAWAMTDLFANEKNPRAMGWVNKQQKDGSHKIVLLEPEKPYGYYKGRYNDHSSCRA